MTIDTSTLFGMWTIPCSWAPNTASQQAREMICSANTVQRTWSSLAASCQEALLVLTIHAAAALRQRLAARQACQHQHDLGKHMCRAVC